jgi:hypothetical protein
MRAMASNVRNDMIFDEGAFLMKYATVMEDVQENDESNSIEGTWKCFRMELGFNFLLAEMPGKDAKRKERNGNSGI